MLARLAERLHLAGPAGFGGEVDLRVQRRPQPQRDVLLTRDVRERADQVGIADGRQAQRLRPLGQRPRGEGHARVLGEPVPGVGGEGDRNAVRGLLGELLHRVLPAHGVPRGSQLVEVEVVDQTPGHQVAGSVGTEGAPLVVRARVSDPDDRVEEQAGLLGRGEPGNQIGHALGGGQPRVLVGVHHPVAVQVPVGDSFR